MPTDTTPTHDGLSSSLEFKLVFVGAANCGKTSLIHQFVSSHFSERMPPTAAMAYRVKDVLLNDRRVQFQLWDTAGQEKFRSMVPQYYRDASAIFVVCDGTVKESVDELRYWLHQVSLHADPSRTQVVTVCNKSDLGTPFLKAVQEHAHTFQEATPTEVCSAKSGRGVFDMFERVGTKCLEKALEKQQSTLLKSASTGTLESVQLSSPKPVAPVSVMEVKCTEISCKRCW